MDAVFLSRIQFGFVMSFHILFPAFTIGLAGWLVFLEALWLRRRTDMLRDLYFFWMKVFAGSFGLVVVSGIVMSFQFGTNWAGLSTVAGSVLGPLPPTMSIWDSASPPSSQGFVLVGAIIMIPAVLFYTAFSYRVFRGKVRAGEGYH